VSAQLIGNLLIFWAAAVYTASAVVHLRVFDRRNPMSLHLLVYMFTLAIVLDLSCVRILFGDSAGFQLLRLVVFVGVPIVGTWRLALQVQAQRETRTARDR
jgi:hypothetical protein